MTEPRFDPPRREHCGHVLDPCGCPNSPDPEQAYVAVRESLMAALDRAHRAEDECADLRDEVERLTVALGSQPQERTKEGEA